MASLQARYRKEPVVPPPASPSAAPADPPKEKKRPRLTPAQMAKEADLQMRQNARPLFELFWKSMETGLKTGEPKTMALFAQIMAYTKNSSVVTLNQQINQGGAATDSRVRRFDGIVSMLEDRDEVRKGIAAPAEISDEDAEDIADPEFDPDAEEDPDVIDAETENIDERAE